MSAASHGFLDIAAWLSRMRFGEFCCIQATNDDKSINLNENTVAAVGRETRFAVWIWRSDCYWNALKRSSVVHTLSEVTHAGALNRSIFRLFIFCRQQYGEFGSVILSIVVVSLVFLWLLSAGHTRLISLCRPQCLLVRRLIKEMFSRHQCLSCCNTLTPPTQRCWTWLSDISQYTDFDIPRTFPCRMYR